MVKLSKLPKPFIAALISVLGLSACAGDEPTATYYPAVPYVNPDAVSTAGGDPEMVLPNNEYAPYAQTIFGYGGGVQDVYFDHYRNDSYRIRNADGITIAFMMRQPYGDYLIVDDYDRVLFSLTYTSGDMYRIVDPLGFHYGFLSYNYEGSFVAMDTRQRMYHNVWFMPMYFAYPIRNRYYRYHRQYDWRHSVRPPQHLTNPDNAPKNDGRRRGRKNVDDGQEETRENRRTIQNRSRSRAETIGERERFLDLESEPRYSSNVRPKKRTNYKAKPRTKTNQGQVTQTWPQKRSMGQEDITREEDNRAQQKARQRSKATKVRQQQRQQAIELRRQQTQQSPQAQPQRQRAQNAEPQTRPQERSQARSQSRPQARQQAGQQPRQAPAPQRQRPANNNQTQVKSTTSKPKSSSASKPSRNKSSRSNNRSSNKPKVHN